jgi:transposase-like protein
VIARLGLYEDEDIARRHIEAIRWPNGPSCPYCGARDNAKRLGGRSMGPGWYRCHRCRRKYTVRVGSIFERSHIPLRKWIYATALITSSQRQLSVRHLRRRLGVSYRSALCMSQRIRQAIRDETSAAFPSEAMSKNAREALVGPQREHRFDA